MRVIIKSDEDETALERPEHETDVQFRGRVDVVLSLLQMRGQQRLDEKLERALKRHSSTRDASDSIHRR